MSRPRLLDLFCCEGGAAKGYRDAGFEVIGVDTEPQPRYPYEFHEADALSVLRSMAYWPNFGGELWRPASYDAIHASPPCQDYSKAMRHLTGGYPRLIDPVRDLLKKIGLPWIIENVPGAPLPVQTDLFGAHGVELCGTMFGLPIWRHRLFETSFPISAPRGCDHTAQPMNPHRAVRRGGRTLEADWREAMGVGWMSRYGAREAVPPVYTESIGLQLVASLVAAKGAA
jgi:DNA (cytosine-5)-methyltransferase 1